MSSPVLGWWGKKSEKFIWNVGGGGGAVFFCKRMKWGNNCRYFYQLGTVQYIYTQE